MNGIRCITSIFSSSDSLLLIVKPGVPCACESIVGLISHKTLVLSTSEIFRFEAKGFTELNGLRVMLFVSSNDSVLDVSKVSPECPELSDVIGSIESFEVRDFLKSANFLSVNFLPDPSSMDLGANFVKLLQDSPVKGVTGKQSSTSCSSCFLFSCSSSNCGNNSVNLSAKCIRPNFVAYLTANINKSGQAMVSMSSLARISTSPRQAKANNLIAVSFNNLLSLSTAIIDDLISVSSNKDLSLSKSHNGSCNDNSCIIGLGFVMGYEQPRHRTAWSI
uniref:Uncharacterized protein n=1 Tax=Glossina brevipalpis TaxID=37001 RepID=A0A1A9WIQ3_9MUSC